LGGHSTPLAQCVHRMAQITIASAPFFSAPNQLCCLYTHPQKCSTGGAAVILVGPV